MVVYELAMDLIASRYVGKLMGHVMVLFKKTSFLPFKTQATRF